MTVIGITGYAQHGKDSLANHFVRDGFTKMAFADQLREALLRLNPIVGDDMLGEVRYGQLLKDVGYEEAKRNPEVRRLLQVMGTEVVRDLLGDESWVNALGMRWFDEGKPRIVVPDVRFHNEADFVERNGTLIAVTRVNDDGTPYDNGLAKDHPSEAFIQELKGRAKHHVVARNLDDIADCYFPLRDGLYDAPSTPYPVLRGPEDPSLTGEDIEELFS